MPRNQYGQLISFGIEVDQDQRFKKWMWVDVKVGDTVQKIASRRAHPEDARKIGDENKIRNLRRVLRHRPPNKNDVKKIKVPGELRSDSTFDVLAGDQPPRVLEGYAKFEVIDRALRVGILTFSGYDPMVLEVPIRYLAGPGGDGSDLEKDIQLLERMAGRGNFRGAATGPPPVIRLSTTGPKGGVVGLLPANYQWSRLNPDAPVWRVTGIDWDAEPRRFDNGNRKEQLATVTVMQHTPINLLQRSAAQRNKAKRAA